MAPIRIIAKCTVIPPGGFLSGPYVIYFYFINIHSTSNLDKYMACFSCIQSRRAAQLHRHKVLCSCTHVTCIALPSLCWGNQTINMKECVEVTGALYWPLCWEIKVWIDSANCNEGWFCDILPCFAPRHLKLGLKQRAHGNNLFCYSDIWEFQNFNFMEP